MSAHDGNTAPEWVPTGSVTVRVPGKVNLYLDVGDCRPDGYHELTTVFHAVSLLDEVTVTTADVFASQTSQPQEGPSGWARRKRREMPNDCQSWPQSYAR